MLNIHMELEMVNIVVPALSCSDIAVNNTYCMLTKAAFT